MQIRSPFLTPQLFKHVGELAHFAVQFFVGDLFNVVFRFTLPDQGHLIFFRRSQVPVQAVDRHVQLPVLEPGVFDDPPFGVPGVLQRLGRELEPAQAFCLFQPEPVRVIQRLPPQFFILLHGFDVRLGGQGRRRRESPAFCHERTDGFFLVAHSFFLSVVSPGGRPTWAPCPSGDHPRNIAESRKTGPIRTSLIRPQFHEPLNFNIVFRPFSRPTGR